MTGPSKPGQARSLRRSQSRLLTLAPNVGPESSAGSDVRVGANVRSVPTPYIGTSGTRLESSTGSDMQADSDVRSAPDADTDAIARQKSSTKVNVGATTARFESPAEDHVHIDASGAEFKPSTGSMYTVAEHSSRYIQETRHIDATTPEHELSTGKSSRRHRRRPETREDDEQSSVMKDDTHSSGGTVKERKKKEDRKFEDRREQDQRLHAT